MLAVGGRSPAKPEFTDRLRREPPYLSVISGYALFTRTPDPEGTHPPVQMGALGIVTTRRQTGRLLSGGDRARAPI